MEAQSFSALIAQAYDEVVHWRMNLFLVPFGKAGKQFVFQLAKLYRAFAEGSALEGIALNASKVLTVLTLQKPYRNSKAKVNSRLERRLNNWKNGQVDELLAEGRSIQKRNFHGGFSPAPSKLDSPTLVRSFAKHMFQGRCGAAIRSLSDKGSMGVLSEDDELPSGDSVFDVLRSKHPPAQGLVKEVLSLPEVIPPPPNHMIYERIDADLIRHADKNTNGAAGPSGLDAHGWRRICCTFKEASDKLYHSLALLARRLCTQFIHPSALAPMLACRLIALDKSPGVRPIGVCEVDRRIISKAILFIIKGDIQEVAGANQLCGGQIAGVEAAVHAVRQLFNSDDTEGILLVDASNAFNSLNRANALANISSQCPPFSTVLVNLYWESSELFLGLNTLLSQEDTTQGDPLAMPFYTLATRPLIDSFTQDSPDVKQIWYADDATAAGKLPDLRKWWEKLLTIGPSFGYFVDPSKTWLVTKDGHVGLASEIFGDTSVNITTQGHLCWARQLKTRLHYAIRSPES